MGLINAIIPSHLHTSFHLTGTQYTLLTLFLILTQISQMTSIRSWPIKQKPAIAQEILCAEQLLGINEST